MSYLGHAFWIASIEIIKQDDVVRHCDIGEKGDNRNQSRELLCWRLHLYKKDGRRKDQNSKKFMQTVKFRNHFFLATVIILISLMIMILTSYCFICF